MPQMFPFRLTRRALLGGAFSTLALSSVRAETGMTAFADTSRLVAIGGSITEIVYALGEQGRLVARDSTSVYPQEALALPDVGYMRQLSPEGVMSVKPTAILALQGSGPREAIDVLKKASVAYIEVPETFDRAGILDKITVVGKALGVEDKAASLAATVGKDIETAESLTRDLAERKRVLFVLSFQGGRFMAAGRNNAADGIITMAGAVNVLDEFEGYKAVSDEAIIAARPDVILMMDRGGGDHTVVNAEILAHPAVATTPAGQAKRLIRMDGSYLLGFGPRTASAIRDLTVALYGDAVAN